MHRYTDAQQTRANSFGGSVVCVCVCAHKSKMEAVNRAEDAAYLHIDLLAFLVLYDFVAIGIHCCWMPLLLRIVAVVAILFRMAAYVHNCIGGGFSCLVWRNLFHLQPSNFRSAIKTI